MRRARTEGDLPCRLIQHQRPIPAKLVKKVALIAGMMTGAHVAAMIVLGLRLGLMVRSPALDR